MNNKRFILSLAIVVLFVLAVLAAGFLGTEKTTDKLKVVATTTQLYDITKNLGGDNVSVSVIYSADTDPHDFQPTPSDVQNIQDAELIIFNGVDLEHTIEDSIEEAKAIKLNASESLVILEPIEAEPHEDEDEDEHEEGDPHIWFDVKNVIKITESIKNKLVELDSTNAALYATKATNYISELEELDTFIKSQIDTIPEDNRKIVTNHDAFGYYINAYGLQFVGSVIPSLSTEDQPTPSETSELIERIKTENVKAIFTEVTLNPKLAQQIANEAGIKVISTLFGDTLGREGTEGDTYIKMMKSNTLEIVNALK